MKKDNDVVEMDAMDVVEWEQGQHTPRAPDAIAELAKQTSQPMKASQPIPKLPTAKNTTQRTPRVTVPTPPAIQQKLEEASVVKTMPVRPTPPPGQYEELVDGSWDAEPAAAKPKIEPYAAPAISRTATPNTFRRDTASRPVVKDEGKTPVIGVPIDSTAAKTPPNGAKSAAIAQADARRPNPTPPRASTMIGVPPVRASEPAILPPPPARDEDWDGLAPSKPSRAPVKQDYPDDPDKEPSVIIDLNSAAAPAPAKQRAQSQPAIQTSEQGTTASGVFVMPTAAAPTGKSIADKGADNKQPISNPTHLEDRAAANKQPISKPVEEDDDLAVPLAPPARDSKPVLNPSAMLRTTQQGHASEARPGDATAAAKAAVALRTTQQGHADAPAATKPSDPDALGISAKLNGGSGATANRADSNGANASGAAEAKPSNGAGPRAKGTGSEAKRPNGAPPPKRSKRSTAASEDAATKIQPAPIAPPQNAATANSTAAAAPTASASSGAAASSISAPLAPAPLVASAPVPASIVRTPTPYPGFQLPTAAPDAGTQVAARAYVDPPKVEPHEELSLDEASESVDEIDAGIGSGRTIEPVVQQAHPGMAFKIDGDRPSFQAYPSASAYLQDAPPARDSGWQPVPDEQVARLASKPRDKRKLILIGGIAAVAVIAIVIMTRGGGSSADKSADKPDDKPVVAAVETPSPTTPTPSPAVAAPVAPPEPAPAEPPPTDTAPPTATPPTAPTPRPAYRRAAKPAKPLVLDYDKPKSEPPPPSDTPDQALAKARAAYARGNQHLFAGEAESAVTQYKQALAVYPGYVAGYRGLGLAYAQQGDNAAALKAFKTYVGLVPNAKDISLIKKRIARLSGQ